MLRQAFVLRGKNRREIIRVLFDGQKTANEISYLTNISISNVCRVLNELKRLKIKKYFQDPDLSPIKLERINKNGDMRIVDSFNITINKKDDIIDYWEKLDIPALAEPIS